MPCLVTLLTHSVWRGEVSQLSLIGCDEWGNDGCQKWSNGVKDVRNGVMECWVSGMKHAHGFLSTNTLCLLNTCVMSPPPQGVI